MRIGIKNALNDKYARFGKDKYRKIKEHGYDCVDFDLANTKVLPYGVAENEAIAIMEGEKKMAEEAGISFFQTHGPWIWPPTNCKTEEEMQTFVEETKFCIRMTKLLGAKHLVLHPAMPYMHEDVKCGKEKETYDANITYFKSLLPYAKEFGITLCLENMPMPLFSIGSPDETVDFIKEINDESLKMCLDTGHLNIYEGYTAGNFVREHSDLVKVFHIHDNMGGGDEHLCPLSGTIDWEDFGKALKEVGYDGVFSLELRLPENGTDEEFEKASKKAFEIASKICN